MVLERIEDTERQLKTQLRRDPKIYAGNVETPSSELPLTADPEASTFHSARGLSSNTGDTITGKGLSRNADPEYRQGLDRNNDYYATPPQNVPSHMAPFSILRDDPYTRYVMREHQDILGISPQERTGYRGLRRVNPRVQISPVVVPVERSYSKEFSMPERHRLDYPEGIPPLRPPEPLTGNVLVMDREVSDAPKQSGSAIAAVPSIKNTLYENEYIGHHRFIYSVNRLPALISVIISLWTLHGKMDSDLRKQNETREAILALTTGLFILAGELYGLHNHNNSHTHACMQTLARVVHLALKVPLSIATIVFSLMAIYDIKDENGEVAPTVQGGALRGYSHNERLTHSAVLLGMSLMVFFLSIIALIYGVFAAKKLIADLRKEKRIRNEQTVSAAADESRSAEHFHTM